MLWWQNKSEEDVINAQLKCREIYEQYLTAASFSKILEKTMLQKCSSFDGNYQPKDSLFLTFLNKIFK